MIGIFYLIIFIFTGSLMADRIFFHHPLYIRLWAGSIIGLVFMMWLVVTFSFLFHFSIISHILALCLLIIIYLLVRAFYRKSSGFKILSDGNETVFFITVIPIFLLIVSLLLSHVLAPGKDGGLYGGQSTYGDLSLHLGIITSIANQGTFPPEYSIFPGKLLSYPFLTDSLSSSMYLLGTSLRWSILLPSFIMVLTLISGFFILANEILRSKFAAALGAVLFFFNGGFGFIYFMNGIVKAPENFTAIFTEYYKTPTNFNEYLIRWSNTICDMIIPQRTTLAGWTVVFFGFWMLYKALSENKKSWFVLAGITAGLLPMIHTHSFLAFGIISAVWSVGYLIGKDCPLLLSKTHNSYSGHSKSYGCKLVLLILLLTFITVPNYGWIAALFSALYFSVLVIINISETNKKEFINYVVSWLYFLVPVIVLALPQLLFWTFPQSSGQNFLRLQSGWSVNEGDLWPWFWIKNIGVVLILTVPAVLSASRKLSCLFLGPVVLFAVSNMIIFQPNNYDNNKLLYIWYLFDVIIVSDYVIKVFKNIKTRASAWVLLIVLIFLAAFSGILTIGREINSAGMLNYSETQIDAGEFIKKSTPKDALFISSDQHLNPVYALAGRNIYSGPPLYIYFHGINYSKRAEEIKKMYQNPDEFKVLSKKLNIDYVYFSSYEKNKFHVDEEFFKENYPEVFHEDDVSIFAISDRVITAIK